jgi:hypothetical protein
LTDIQHTEFLSDDVIQFVNMYILKSWHHVLPRIIRTQGDVQSIARQNGANAEITELSTRTTRT